MIINRKLKIFCRCSLFLPDRAKDFSAPLLICRQNGKKEVKFVEHFSCFLSYTRKRLTKKRNVASRCPMF
jgi:hypothetical protein